ncbi:alpha/beta hydrolase family protein [Gottfriedia acidiceleris]|uniref:alpha/beta hydrolase family protein n=1 Tax=Gottfriedia acidiceleris TaxID=371036 RepID=UPI00101DEF9A|nr:S9 family peptidase [Gottfriedia acidiceleris]
MSLRLTIPEDIYRFEWPSNPVISPNGKQVIYEKSTACQSGNDYLTHLFLANIEGTSDQQLTTKGTRNTHPVWSPNGNTIAYLSNRSYGSQIWVLSLDSRLESCLTKFKHGISSIIWSPNSDMIYGLVPVAQDGEVEVFYENITEAQASDEISARNKQWLEGSKSFNQLYYKNDGIGLQNLYTRQLVSINVKTGEFKQLTNRPNHISDPAISPDGKYIAFTSLNDGESGLYGRRIYSISVHGGEEKLVYSKANAHSLSYSPDGKWIAYFSNHHNQIQLLLIPADGGEVRCLSKQYHDTLSDMIFTDMRFLKSPLKPQWSQNGKYVFGLGTREGRNEIVRFAVDDSDGRGRIVVGGDRTIFHFSYNGDQTFVIAYSSVEHPGKIAVVNVEKDTGYNYKKREPKEDLSIQEVSSFSTNEVRIDHCNDAFLSEVKVVKPEVLSYLSEDDWHVQGFVLKPANFEEGKKYPVLLDIHGGPHSSFGYTYFHQMQLFSAHGFAVVYLNPRGTSGFGEDFTNAVCGDYGGKDMKDLFNGLNEALRRFDFLDKNKVAVNGISYGGFMVNWLITHTNQFFAAVSEGCISNWVSMYGTSDIAPEFMDVEFQGKTDVELLWKRSPLAYVENVNTPLLLLHNESDLRCPIEQAEQFYSQIKRRGGEVEFARIPNSSHALLQVGKPTLRIERLEAMLDFVTSRLPE